MDERGGGREHYGYSPIKTEELSWYSLMKEFNGDDNYRWGSNFTKMLVEKLETQMKVFEKKEKDEIS